MKNQTPSKAVAKEIQAAVSKKQTSKDEDIQLEVKLLIGAVIAGAFVLAFYCAIYGQS